MTIIDAVEVISSVKPNNGSTLIHLVLDETGSMGHVRQNTINSVNEYLNSQRGDPGDCFVTLTTFDVGHSRPIVRDIFRHIPISDVIDLTFDTYSPYGSTNLYDAIGHSISTTTSELEKQDTTPNVLLVIVTDGEENASKEYNLNQIQSLIAEKQKENWTIVYLGANQDAWKVGQSFGLSKGQTKSYDVADIKSTLRTLSESTTLYRSARVAGAYAQNSVEQNFFSDVDNTTPDFLENIKLHKTHIYGALHPDTPADNKE
jgi:hypothetical protein